MVKNLMTMIQVNMLPESWLLPLTYHHSHFFAATFDFKTFSYFKGACTFFTAQMF